jgi:BirA family biotin operon repressor/biotin-[acetyl-CoA-carboxylase] ligase
LTSADLLSQGPLRRLGRRVFLHDTLDSTNRFLLDHAADAGDGAVACAESQSAGRGRLGRRWEAPRGSSVLLSVLLHEPADTPLLSQGALLASVAACEAVAAATDCSTGRALANDVVLNGRKLEVCWRSRVRLRTAEGAARRAW